MRQRLQQAGFTTATARQFWIVSGSLAGLVGALLPDLPARRWIVIALATFVVGLGLPRWVLNFLKKRREKAFTAEFANAIDVIVRSVRSGLPTNEALRIVARELPDPVGSEFNTLCEGLKVGVTLEQGVKKMLESMPTAEVSFFGIVMTIQQKSGGNLSEALGNLAGVLRDRKRLRGQDQGDVVGSQGVGRHHRFAAAGRDGHRLPDDARLHQTAVHRTVWAT